MSKLFFIQACAAYKQYDNNHPIFTLTVQEACASIYAVVMKTKKEEYEACAPTYL